MAKFHVEVTFRLRTDIEPDGSLEGVEYEDDVAEYEDQSAFYGDSFELDGGTVSFVLSARGEAEAVERAVELVEGASFSDQITGWEIIDVDATVLDVIQEPMTFERALEMVAALVAAHPELAEEEREAIDFLLKLAKERQAQVVAGVRL